MEGVTQWSRRLFAVEPTLTKFQRIACNTLSQSLDLFKAARNSDTDNIRIIDSLIKQDWQKLDKENDRTFSRM